MGALEFLCDSRFHQTFVLPPDPEIGRHRSYRFSYADFGDESSDAVVLFCGAIMGSRFCYADLDQLALAYKVRIIHPDRPGVGGSDPVDLDKRIQLWLEMVPKLLEHLNIAHISLAGHSGGTIYVLNTMLTYPHLLHPVDPYVCFFAPGVLPAHSKVTQMRATDLLPAPMIGKFASVAKFVSDKNLMQLVDGLTDAVRSCLPRHKSIAPSQLPSLDTESQLTSTDTFQSLPSHILDDQENLAEFYELVVTFMFAERIEGMSADAQLFMKKPRSIQWCSPSIAWSDVDYFVPFFSKIIGEDSTVNTQDRVWSIDTFHAETDSMVGEKGQRWFDDCWLLREEHEFDRDGGSSPDYSDQAYRLIDYKSVVVHDENHNSIATLGSLASVLWLRRVRESFSLKEDENEP